MMVDAGLFSGAQYLWTSGRSLPALFRFNYPFSIAWHAPIIPYMVLGAGFLVRVMEKSSFRLFVVCYFRLLSRPQCSSCWR